MASVPEEAHAEATSVYRLFDVGGRLLYVGVAVDPERRFQDHRRDKFWWHLVTRKSIEQFPRRDLALQAEAVAIREESPVYDGTARIADWKNAHLTRPDDPFWRPVAEALLQRIETGEYQRAGRLPPATRLATEFEVSSVSVHRAFYWLADRKAVSIRAGVAHIPNQPATRTDLAHKCDVRTRSTAPSGTRGVDEQG